MIAVYKITMWAFIFGCEENSLIHAYLASKQYNIIITITITR